jgi:hypothetical protein
MQHKLEKPAIAADNPCPVHHRSHPMPLQQLLEQIRHQPQLVDFHQVMQVIEQHYDYQPTAFSNGIEDDRVDNPAGQNEGSCKIFAFARLNGLNEAETLACFGDFYRRDVLQNPQGDDHANIRRFMRHGWTGVRFDNFPLSARP